MRVAWSSGEGHGRVRQVRWEYQGDFMWDFMRDFIRVFKDYSKCVQTSVVILSEV